MLEARREGFVAIATPLTLRFLTIMTSERKKKAIGVVRNDARVEDNACNGKLF
jgi:hypothetical protein